MIFVHREEAGKKLAEKLRHVGKNSVVLGLARGGVVIAAEIAKELGIPLDVIVVRKIPAPDNEELAIGAIAEERALFNEDILSMYGISKEYIHSEIEKQKQLIKKRKQMYLEGRSPQIVSGKTVIIVDDGIATGATMRAAIQAIKQQKPSKVILAVPVSSKDAFQELSKEVDEAICLYLPEQFYAVGAFYKQFSQVSDEEVIALLKQNSLT